MLENIVLKNNMDIIKGLKFGLNEKKENVTKETYCSYSGTVSFLETAANNLKIQNLKIVDLNRDHVKSLLTEASKNRKWTNKTYNTHLLHLKIIFVLIEENVLESNPATRIKIKK
jgi:formate dehydrogenase assembly factor FdhD